jgi:heat shock protein HslJ
MKTSSLRLVTCLAAAAMASWASAADTTPSSTAKAPPAVAPYRAGGNEPGWHLVIAGGVITLLLDNGQTKVEAATTRPAATPVLRKYVARADGKDLLVTVHNERCADTMTGMPFPNTVEVVFDGRKLNGCGGDPASLLHGPQWSVVEIDGAAILAQPKVTLNFGVDGRVSGKASCNAYTATYLLTGEGLSFTRSAGAKMACDEPLMRQEALFLDVLGKVMAFTIEPDGALVLRTADKRSIKARRPG